VCNIEIPDDEIEISDDLLELDLDNWEKFERYLLKQLDLEKEE